MTPFVLASVFVISGVVVETLCAGKEPSGVMKKLHPPRWAFPMPVWYAVGFFYYVMCFAVVYRMTASGRSEAPGLMLIAALMAANAGWNLIFFRLRSLRWSFWFYVPYIVLAAALIRALWSVDRVSTTLLLIYSAYLPYAIVWSYFVMRLNASPSNHSIGGPISGP
ncbi:MAG: tryptophan-rich sensory protein [Acidobacteria bacterium]|nr:tryptophan-rich sensory protein [Acidobacteriota bacterium]